MKRNRFLWFNICMFVSNEWKSYQCIDAGDKKRLEIWDNVTLNRPDPTCIWDKTLKDDLWNKADAIYHRSNKGGGHWEFKKKIKESWTIDYKDLKFKVSPTGFKHTGLFPEQATNWDLIMDLIRQSGRNDIKVLNLFAYSGGATMAASKAGAKEVVHVDASKGMIAWAKENMQLNQLQDHTIRFMVDDCMKFIQREIRRGNHYDGIILDPPSYGRGPNGELWKLEEQLAQLVSLSAQLLSDDPLFYIINCYTSGFSQTTLYNILSTKLPKNNRHLVVDEIGLPINSSDLIIPCGIVGRGIYAY